jgi:hypothetical protein
MSHKTHQFLTQNVRNHVYGGAMTNRDYGREPPLAGTEAEHLCGLRQHLAPADMLREDARETL